MACKAMFSVFLLHIANIIPRVANAFTTCCTATNTLPG